jgi:hypothetical protein
MRAATAKPIWQLSAVVSSSAGLTLKASQDTVLSVPAGLQLGARQLPVRQRNCRLGSLPRYSTFVARLKQSAVPVPKGQRSAWQRRTNVWQRTTSPAREAKRLRGGSAKSGGIRGRVPASRRRFRKTMTLQGRQIDRASSRAHSVPRAPAWRHRPGRSRARQ